MAKKKRSATNQNATKTAGSEQFEKAFRALATIEQKLSRRSELTAQPLDLDEACARYGEIKPFLKPALDFVVWLPHGDTLRTIIETLMELADDYCGQKPASLSADRRASSGEEALSRIEAVLQGDRPGAEPLAKDFGPEACNTYHAIRRFIEPALEFVDLLPYGPTIVKIVRLLVKLADVIC
jgi:hypothetical protein